MKHALQLFVGGIGLNLLPGLAPLPVSLGIGGIGLEVLQLKDVTVPDHWIDRIIGQQEEVAVAVRELHLRGNEIVVGQREVGVHEALQVALALDELADGGGVVVGLADERDERLPVTLKGSLVEGIVQVGDVDGMDGAVFVQQILIVLQPDVVVGDDELEAVAHHTADGEHAIVVEQADEVAELHHLLGWEMRDEARLDETLLGNVVNDLDALALGLVYLYQPLQLTVVGHRIRVDELFRPLPHSDEVAQVVAHHVAVEHAGLTTKTVFGKAVVVVPRLHVSDDAVLGHFRLDGTHLFIVAYHLPDIVL